MKKTALLLLAAALACACGGAHPKPEPADLVFSGGKIHTMGQPELAESLVLRRGKVVFAGTDKAARTWVGRKTAVVDLKGRTVLPGFHDSHVHPVTGGVELGDCNLNGLGSAEKVLEKVRECAKTVPEGWIQGGGWDLPLFPDSNPGKELLDAAAPGRPVYLTAADGHSGWASSTALALAKVTAATKDPKNGRIERDKNGAPSGVLREEAMSLVSDLVPEHSAQDYLEGGRRALKMAAGFGLTTLYEAAADEKVLGAYAELDRAGELTARVNVAFELKPSSGLAGAAALGDLRGHYEGRFLRVVGAKFFADGVIEARTAAMLAPYADKGGFGTANWKQEELSDTAAALDKQGFQVHVHAIGDRAVRMALDAIAAARKRNGPGGPHHTIAHLQLVAPADLPLFKDLDATACFQPLWAFKDKYITELTIPGLGEERSSRIYPMGSALRAGAPLACGSDWSVSSMNPWEAIEVGVTRRGPEEGAGEPWLPQEVLPLETLLRCYTTGGARANLQEGLTGSLEPGKAGDLIVLDKDPYAIPPNELKSVKVLETYLEGRRVFAR